MILREQGIKKLHSTLVFTKQEIEVLRNLAERVAKIADGSDMKKKAKVWEEHNDLKTTEPLIYINPENGWNEIITYKQIMCSDPLAKKWEMMLRKEIYQTEVLKDDKVILPCFDVEYSYFDTGWGMEPQKIGGENGGAYHIKQILEDYDRDFPKIHHPEIVIDEKETQKALELAYHIFDGILEVQSRQDWWWSFGLTWDYIDLRGMEDFMCDFLEEPEWVMRMFRLLTDGKHKMLNYLEQNGLLSPNHDGRYIGSGGFGYTSQLSLKEDTITTKNLWGFCESQETVAMNPAFYGEFILPFHQELMSRFGMTYYGCCEPYETRWEYVRQLPNLRRVSVCPWSDWSSVPKLLGKNYVAAVKLNPALLAMSHMDEEAVRSDCRRAVKETDGGICEFIMKDTHTLGKNPKNAIRWVEIMREELLR